jgi:hypothetical protein
LSSGPEESKRFQGGSSSHFWALQASIIAAYSLERLFQVKNADALGFPKADVDSEPDSA